MKFDDRIEYGVVELCTLEHESRKETRRCTISNSGMRDNQRENSDKRICESNFSLYFGKMLPGKGKSSRENKLEKRNVVKIYHRAQFYMYIYIYINRLVRRRNFRFSMLSIERTASRACLVSFEARIVYDSILISIWIRREHETAGRGGEYTEIKFIIRLRCKRVFRSVYKHFLLRSAPGLHWR